MGEIVGLIPARSGSKGIPRKNLVELAGQPLLGYTAAAALGARRLPRTLLSTDSPEIAEFGRRSGLTIPFMRPADLSSDGTLMLPVIVHALDWLEAHGCNVDGLVLLQPTSPLRTAQHIDECVDLFITSGADTVVSVVEVPHQFNPASIMIYDDGFLRPFSGAPAPLRRQDKPRVYARNGPAILAVRPATLRSGSLYGAKTLGYEMDASASVDVDTPDDLWLAEQLLKHRRS